MKKVKYVPSYEHSECALSCITMISQYFNKDVSLTKLREYYGVPQGGYSISQMIEIFKNNGLTAKGVKILNFDFFEDPFIAYYAENHFVIVEKIKKTSITIIDPSIGRIVLNKSEFLKNFLNIGIVICDNDPKITKVRKLKKSFFLDLVYKHKRKLGNIIIISIIMQMVALLVPSIIQKVLDMYNGNSFDKSNYLFLEIAFLAILYYFSNVIRRILITKVQNVFDKDLTGTTMEKMLNLPFKFFVNRGRGELLFTINSNQYIRTFLSSNIISIVIDLLFSFFYCYLMMRYSIYLTIITICVAMFLFFITILDTQFLLSKNQHQLKAINENQNISNEIITNIETIKAVNAEKNLLLKWNRSFDNQLKIEMEKTKIDAFLSGIPVTVSLILPLVIYAFGMRLGGLSTGTLVAFNSLSMSFLVPILSLASSYFQIISGQVYIQQLVDVLNSEEESPSITKKETIQIEQGSIELKKISYKYDFFSELVLDEVSLKIESGEKIAIVGESGSGKSTIMKIIAGMLFPKEGEIYVDKKKITQESIDLTSYRNSLGILLQNNSLFTGSIKDNICLGRTVSEEELNIVLKKTDLRDFIEKLPNGLETIISEGGKNLSGGQVQRICIARSMLKNSQIYLLDEPTSSLDPLSERKIMHTLLNNKSTVIVVSHRLTNINSFDKIIVMYNGKIFSVGTHEFLLENCEYYRSLYRTSII